jgi:hypothetical protein
MFVLACIEHLCVPRHATPLTRPPIELSINTLGARIASNSVHIYNLSINTLGASTTSNSVHIYNPNFPLAFTNSVSEMSPFARQSINDANWLKNCVYEGTLPFGPLLEVVATFCGMRVPAALDGDGPCGPWLAPVLADANGNATRLAGLWPNTVATFCQKSGWCHATVSLRPIGTHTQIGAGVGRALDS